MKLTRHLTIIASLTVLVALAITVVQPGSVNALSGNQFDASNIIGSGVFFNSSTMTVTDIQNFLNSKVPVCDTYGAQPSGHAGYATRADWSRANGYDPPYTCLKDYYESIPSKAADSLCDGSISGGTKSASQLIYDVAQACSTNPKVLIVLLQKEQGLVTDDWPWPIQYRAATGYGCPDTAACDSAYYGFFNQIYNAARQYQRYARQSNLFNYRNGVTSYVQYNPNGGCGGTNITMQNQATAGLYNYTPYQPNAAALNNLYGTGDGCSAYGNRNFWRMFSDWFGSTQSSAPYAWLYQGQQAFSDSAMTQPFTATPTATPGSKIYVRVKALNIGTQTWDQSFMHLGTSRPMDRSSQFVDSTWLSASRPAALKESSVSPGIVGTFEFAMKAPATTGTYNEYFNVLAEGRTWLNDPGLFFTVNVNNAVGASNPNSSILASGASLTKDSALISPDSQSSLTLQRDGNLVLYSNFEPVWSTGALGSSGNRLVMQADGNLVYYNQSNQPLWASGTNGNSGARLVIQTDGNMVIYSASNTPLWATYTIQNPDHLSYINTTMKVGRMYPGQSIDTADRRYHLIMQRDGNLVLYSPTQALWATGTDGRSVAFMALQADGNLVLYDTSGRPIWYTGSSGTNLRLVVQQDGNLVLYNRSNIPHWNTETAGR